MNNNIKPRKSVKRFVQKMEASIPEFSQQMEQKLLENKHKGGWENERFEYFCEKLHETLHKLTAQRFENTPDWNKVIKESVNIGNYAMMAAEYASKRLEKAGVTHE
ncbi:hypothetical protein D3C74_207470 [compost metagenome]